MVQLRTIGEEDLSGLYPIRCLVSAIGTNFMPGCLDNLIQSIFYANDRGFDVDFECVKDVSIKPSEGVPMMRNRAIVASLEGQYDYLFMIDNDFLMDDHSVLFRLLLSGQPLMTPWYDQSELPLYIEEGEFVRIQQPMIYPDQGMVPINWISINCIMFQTGIFRVTGPELFPMGIVTNKEEYIFAKLRTHGFRLWQNSDVRVKMLKPPNPAWEMLGLPNPNPATEEAQLKSESITRRVEELRQEWKGEDDVLPADRPIPAVS